MKRLLYVLAALFAFATGAAAQSQGYGWPMDLKPASFSSTYGELRRNHFHAGLDWRTGGHVGEPLKAIKAGYVCRLSVSPVGYGNAVYIQHPDGTMSVYGHMDRFRDDIARRVRAEQYKNKSYKVYFELGPDEFPLEKGEVFGYSGNTGSSGGPHLHMEIRTDGDNLPINYLASGVYPVSDSKKPVIRRVAFYAFEDSVTVPAVRRLAMISNPDKHKGTVDVSDKFYVAIDAVDYMEGSSGRLAVENYRVYIDSEKVYDFKVGNVPYSEGRYFACLVQQGERGADMLKTWCVPNNGLLYKIDAANDGIFSLEDNATHTLKVVVSDCFGNASSCSFNIRKDSSIKVFDPADTVGCLAALWYVPQVYSRDGMTMLIEPGSLNASAYIKCEKLAPADPSLGRYSDMWSVGDGSIHLQKRIKLSLSTADVPDSLKDKCYIVRKDSDGELSFAGNRMLCGTVAADCRFGTYYVAVDTEPPVLRPRVEAGTKLPDNGRFSIEAIDLESGVESFNAEMDGKWILSQFVGSRIQIYPDSSHRSGGRHTMKVSATDHCGNSSEVEFDVIY